MNYVLYLIGLEAYLLLFVVFLVHFYSDFRISVCGLFKFQINF